MIAWFFLAGFAAGFFFAGFGFRFRLRACGLRLRLRRGVRTWPSVGRGLVHGQKAHLVADPVIGVNLGDRNVTVGAEPLGDVDHRRRHIQMKRGFEPPERHPLGQRLEVVDRFDGLDLDDRHHLPASVLRDEHDIGKDGRDTGPDGAVLLGPGVDADIETTAKLGL